MGGGRLGRRRRERASAAAAAAAGHRDGRWKRCPTRGEWAVEVEGRKGHGGLGGGWDQSSNLGEPAYLSTVAKGSKSSRFFR